MLRFRPPHHRHRHHHHLGQEVAQVVAAEVAVGAVATAFAIGGAAAGFRPRRQRPQVLVVQSPAPSIAAPVPRRSRAIVEEAAAPLRVQSLQLPTHALEDREGVTFFAVDVVPEDGSGPWRVMRRYNDFYDLYTRLGWRAQCFPDATFPRKHIFACTGEKLEARRRGLEHWLRRAVESPYSADAAWLGQLRGFLEAGRRLAPALQEDGEGAATLRWQVEVGDSWQDFDEVEQMAIARALRAGAPCARFEARGFEYEVHFAERVQRNLKTRKERRVRPAPQLSLAEVPASPGMAAASPPLPPPLLGPGAQEGTSPAATSEGVLLQIVVPPGVSAGQLLGINVPGGQQFNLPVPESAVPGTQLELWYDPVTQTLEALS